MEKVPDLTTEEAEIVVSLLGSMSYRIFVEKVLAWREINARNALLRAANDKELLERARRWQLFALSLEDHEDLPRLIEQGLTAARKEDIMTEDGLRTAPTPWDVS